MFPAACPAMPIQPIPQLLEWALWEQKMRPVTQPNTAEAAAEAANQMVRDGLLELPYLAEEAAGPAEQLTVQIIRN